MSFFKRALPLLAMLLSAFTSQAQEQGRIVEGRPPLYTLKRDLHPLTWLEIAAKPVFRLAESDRAKQFLEGGHDNDKVSGVTFGLGGVGTGSGFGPQVTFFDKDLLGRGIDVEMPLTYTYSRYESYKLSVSAPLIRESFVDRLSIDLGTSYTSRAKDDFFGIGNETPFTRDVQLRTVGREVSTGVTARFNDAWNSGVHVSYRNVGVTEPRGGTVSAQNRYRNAPVPALLTGAALRALSFSVTHDTKAHEERAFEGGRDELGVSRNESAGKGDFAYWKYFFRTEHFFPLTRDGRRAIAARAFVEENRTDGRSQVPFFDMPSLGSFENLRGFENFRFRDKSALAASLEYRYRIWDAMDFGLFVDEGQVAPRLGDLSLNHFHTGYGTRLFIWPKKDFPISIDYGRSRETWRMYVNFNTNF